MPRRNEVESDSGEEPVDPNKKSKDFEESLAVLERKFERQNFEYQVEQGINQARDLLRERFENSQE